MVDGCIYLLSLESDSDTILWTNPHQHRSYHSLKLSISDDAIRVVVKRALSSATRSAFCIKPTVICIIFFFRGCSFVSKSVNAELYGAVAVVITDSDPNENTNWIDMIGDGTERENNIGIPAFFMMGKDGYVVAITLFSTK